MGNTHVKITHYTNYTLKTRPTTLELPPGNALTAKTKVYTPVCKGCLNTLGDTVSNERPHLCFGTSSPIMPKFVEKLQLYNCEPSSRPD